VEIVVVDGSDRKRLLIMLRVTLRPTFTLLLFFTLTLGLVYPLVVTAIAHAIFPFQANGSILTLNGEPVGSALIGQPFSAPEYFWGRPSATDGMPYNAADSSGSNLAPTNAELLAQVEARVAALQVSAYGDWPIPVDLVTASASGLDPHISVAGAYYQVPRVAEARNLDPEDVRHLIDQLTEGGILSEARVNVLKLNLALDGVQSQK
jgi:potassium-transporting ATPase KdpC subunit